MTVYITKETEETIKNSYLNFKKIKPVFFSIDDIIETLELDISNEIAKHILNEEISKVIKSSSRKKNFCFIFSYSNLSSASIPTILDEFLKYEKKYTRFVFLDSEINKNKEYYDYFSYVGVIPVLSPFTLLKNTVQQTDWIADFSDCDGL